MALIVARGLTKPLVASVNNLCCVDMRKVVVTDRHCNNVYCGGIVYPVFDEHGVSQWRKGCSLRITGLSAQKAHVNAAIVGAVRS